MVSAFLERNLYLLFSIALRVQKPIARESEKKNLFYNKQQGHFHHLGRIILMKEKPIMKEDGGGSLVIFGLTYTAATIIRS